MYQQNNGISSNHCRVFDISDNVATDDWHSMALHPKGTHLLLVGNRELAWINLDTVRASGDHQTGHGMGARPKISDFEVLPLFDTCNTNRPVVQWNPLRTDQYAVAIDRLVHLYTRECKPIERNSEIMVPEHRTSAIIDSQHQRPITTLCYSPHDPFWLLTGSLDGQVQVWDTRECTAKSAASLKFSVSTPFSIRRIQWSSNQSDNFNQLAVQCERCIRVYDIRRAKPYISSTNDLEHTQRILSMDWTMQTDSVVSLSMDQSVRVFSSTGQILAESAPNETPSLTLSKIRSTSDDNLFIGACRDAISSTFGFVGWRRDDDHLMRPMNDRVIAATPSAIVDFCTTTNSRLLKFFDNSPPSSPSSRSSAGASHRFALLALCRTGELCLVDMDAMFRQTWRDHSARAKINSLSDSSGITRPASNHHRQQAHRHSSTIMMMDVIKDEATIDAEDTFDDHCFQALSTSPLNMLELSDAEEDVNTSLIPDRHNNTVTTMSVTNEFESLHDTYGPHITVEARDDERRMCVLRCVCSLDSSTWFRLYLILSRHYPIISQLSVRFKLSTATPDDELKLFQTRIQAMFETTSQDCFYRGQLCLHKCLAKLQNLFDAFYKQEKASAAAIASPRATQKNQHHSHSHFRMDSQDSSITDSTGNTHTAQTNNNNFSGRAFAGSSSSTRTSDSQLSGASFAQGQRRTCGARFSGATYLVCFGRISHGKNLSAAPTSTTLTDSAVNRTQSLPMRSASLTVAKSRENSSTDEQAIYRPPATGTMQIQQTVNNQRLPMFSAPVRSMPSTSVGRHHERMSISHRRSLGQLIHAQSTVALYDVSILLPVSRKLADDYKIDLSDSIYMCEKNHSLTVEMAKHDLAHSWRLLGGLLSLQLNLEPNDPWFQTPIAQGLIKHLVADYAINGDIQSASMFLLTMSQTPFLKTMIQAKLVNEHDNDPILYAYASFLHRCTHFYKRTQILSQIDHNCQSPAPFTSTAATIICSICLRPVRGQHFLCAVCGHGGHLTHMHEWFSSEESKHCICPEKDCTCRCIQRQQDVLNQNTLHMQQQQHQHQQYHTPAILSRTFPSRQLSENVRPF